jgi:hypothetical protein
MEAEQNLTVCDHFGKLDKKALYKLFDEWAEGGKCYENHAMLKVPENKELLVSLSGYVLGCARNSAHKCLLKAFEEDKKHCLTLNPDTGSLW